MKAPEPRGVVAVFDTREGAASAIEWLRVGGVNGHGDPQESVANWLVAG